VNRIITRGLGPVALVVTLGYGGATLPVEPRPTPRTFTPRAEVRLLATSALAQTRALEVETRAWTPVVERRVDVTRASTCLRLDAETRAIALAPERRTFTPAPVARAVVASARSTFTPEVERRTLTPTPAPRSWSAPDEY
jgi:hypothetical protein